MSLFIFSPVLVRTAIVVFLIVSGIVAFSGFRVAALSVLFWMYKCLIGKLLPGVNKIDYARARVVAKARDIKESVQHCIDQAQSPLGD